MRARVIGVTIGGHDMLGVSVAVALAKSGVQVIGRAEFQDIRMEAYNLPAWRDLAGIPQQSYGPERKGRGGKVKRWRA